MKSSAIAAAIAASLVATPAAAVIVGQGEIESDGALTTVDLWFFSLPVAASTTIVASPLSVGPPLSGLENPHLMVYRNDGALDAADFVAGVDDTLGLTPQLALNLAAGDYVFAVGASGLAVGEFGPIQADALSTLGFVYELGISDAGGNEGALTCVLDGQLDGGFGRRVVSIDNCVEPVRMSEPGALLLLGAAAAAATLLARRRRGEA